MINTIILLIGIIIMAFSVTAIYDARKIAQKFFSSDNLNKNVKVIKTVGTIVVWITLGIIYMVH